MAENEELIDSTKSNGGKTAVRGKRTDNRLGQVTITAIGRKIINGEGNDESERGNTNTMTRIWNIWEADSTGTKKSSSIEFRKIDEVDENIEGKLTEIAEQIKCDRRVDIDRLRCHVMLQVVTSQVLISQ
ncbi:hypothetical protein J6590_103276 [Homalodisca vitripennis]|nr:hypothetical protein J6590_020901 [Homalodisca vitripennis]KAG8294425.1 hypothetical protein J6590_103276 [Homalodisca vitripennis]